MTLTFASVDKILWCDNSNESSPPVLTHGAIFFKISQNEISTFSRNLLLAKFGSERVRGIYHATCYLFKKLERFSRQLNFKNNGLVLLFKTIFRH